MSEVKVTVGGAIEGEISQRFINAWHRAKRGETFEEHHLTQSPKSIPPKSCTHREPEYRQNYSRILFRDTMYSSNTTLVVKSIRTVEKEPEMKKVLKHVLLVTGAAVILSISAHGQSGSASQGAGAGKVTAPEVDPALALGGLALLAGSLTVVRARRR